VIGERFNAYSVVSRCNRRRRQNSSGFERILTPMNSCANVSPFRHRSTRASARCEKQDQNSCRSFSLSSHLEGRKRVIHSRRVHIIRLGRRILWVGGEIEKRREARGTRGRLSSNDLGPVRIEVSSRLNIGDRFVSSASRLR